MGAERLRILYVQPNSEVGGSDLALLRLVETIDQQRYEPVVLLPHDGPIAARLRAAGAAVHMLPMMQLRTLPSPVYQGRYLLRFWPTVWRLRQLILRERIDLVHTNSLYSLYAPFAAFAARRPHLWHIREIPPQIPVARPALGRLVLALSTVVISMTQACTRGLFGDARPDKVRLLAEGLDLETWSRKSAARDIRGELGIAATVPVIGFVARLDPWKGLDVFIAAAAIVARRHPDAVFLVAGDAPDGFEAYRDAMIAKAAELGLADQVRFLGWRYRMDDIPAVMAALDIFSHTSIQPEPFGLVVIEAMAVGCPVVAARAGGPLEIIEDGVSGVLTEPGDAEALAQALLALLASPERRRDLAAAGRRRVETTYSRQALRQAIGAIYEAARQGAPR